MRPVKGKSRRQSGNVIAETPPALFILFIVIFVPMLSLIALGVKYGVCYSLNVMQSNEAALIPASKAGSDSGPIRLGIPKSWKDSGMGAFVDLNQPLPTTVLRYEKGAMGANGVQEQFVYVSTTFQLRPFITNDNAPFANVPGLTAPLNFTIESSRPLENPTNADK